MLTHAFSRATCPFPTAESTRRDPPEVVQQDGMWRAEAGPFITSCPGGGSARTNVSSRPRRRESCTNAGAPQVIHQTSAPGPGTRPPHRDVLQRSHDQPSQLRMGTGPVLRLMGTCPRNGGGVTETGSPLRMKASTHTHTHTGGSRPGVRPRWRVGEEACP